MNNPINEIELEIDTEIRVTPANAWVRPKGWPNLDKYKYGTDELYMTFDNTDYDGGCAFCINGTPYTVSVGCETWTLDAGKVFTCAFTKANGKYPVVHVKADGNITRFDFMDYPNGKKGYAARSNRLLERVGDVYDYGGGIWGTYTLVREKVVRHACNNTLGNTFNGCSALQSLDLSGLDTSNWTVTDMSYTFGSVRCLKQVNTGEKMRNHFTPTETYIRMQESTSLTEESIVNIGDTLGTVTTRHVLSIGTINAKKLTEEEKKAITDKGWTIA